MKGGTVQRTPEGISVINRAYSRTYQIDMAQILENKYDTTASIAGYTVGLPGLNSTPLGSHTLTADTIYKLTITGSGSSLVVSGLTTVGPINFDDFFGGT